MPHGSSRRCQISAVGRNVLQELRLSPTEIANGKLLDDGGGPLAQPYCKETTNAGYQQLLLTSTVVDMVLTFLWRLRRRNADCLYLFVDGWDLKHG
jgi:hypothetical protein